MKHNIIRYFAVILILLFVSSCSVTKKTKQQEVIIEKEDKCKYETFTSRYKGSYNGIPFKIQVRAAYDSVIWCSLSALSMEAGRMLITNDSVFVMNKINKEVYKKSKNELSILLQEDLSNPVLEKMIVDSLSFEKHLSLKTKPLIDLVIKKTIDKNSNQNYNINLSLGKTKYLLDVLQESIEYNKTQQYPFNIPSSYKIK
ncbi:MAG: DUF4292 domain-containing protein [Bacteroidales bacterium]|nr:DUF4292 domain-containing protein [Bacteroidales bacterium]